MICKNIRIKNILVILFSLCVIVLPILYEYKGVSLVSLGETLILIVSLLCFFFYDFSKFKLSLPLYFLYFFTLLSLFVNFRFPYFSFESSFSLILRMFFYIFIIVIGREFFNYKKISRFYIVLTLVFSIYVIAQFALKQFFSFNLPNLFIKNLIIESEAKNLLPEGSSISNRPSGPFLEPSYFSLFGLPAAFLCLKQKKKNIFVFFLFFIAMAVSLCLSGVFGCLLILSFFGIKALYKSNLRYFYILIPILIITVIVASVTDIFEPLFKRISSGGSFIQRVLNGPVIYTKLDFYHKIFGTGLGNITNYLEYYKIVTGIQYYGAAYEGYSSSFFSILNSGGIFAFASFLFFLVRFLKSRSNSTLCFAILFLFVCLYESIFFTYRFCFYAIFLFNLNKDEPEFYYCTV